MKTSLSRALVATIVMAYAALAGAQPLACASRQGGAGARIDEASFVRLGGIEQFVTLRGDDRGNPVLLHVHGGPGIAFSAFAAEFAAFEADFTVVQWDQRGSGCTYGRAGEATSELALGQLVADGVELAEQLGARFGGRKIVVLGHSFGSVVAIDMVRRAPLRFALYVGTGQFASFARAVDAQVAELRERAAGDVDLLSQLDALSALDSRSLQKFGGVNRLLPSRMPAPDVAFMQRLPARAAELMAPEELAAWGAGRQASGSQLIRQISGLDLFAAASRVEVPFLVIQGSGDLNTPTVVARAYFDQVEAPAKELVVIEGAGHFPHLTHTPEFLTVLRAYASRFATP
jgi:pimeloyl-ACP methyl ester carboxylesterase